MSLVLFAVGSLLAAAVLSAAGAWTFRRLPVGSRRPLALLALALPVFVLALASTHLARRLIGECGLAAPDRWVAYAFLAWVGGSFVRAGVLAALSLRRLRWLAQFPPAPRDLAARAEALASRMKAPRPRLRWWDTPAFVAAGGWSWGPTVVLSRGLVDGLDEHELDAVLAHELAHLARHALHVLLLARLLRDTTWYLPWAREAFQVLYAEEELLADAAAADATRDPLTLASALARAVQHALEVPALGVGLQGTQARLLEDRLKRLLEGSWRPAPALPGSLAAGALALAAARTLPQLLSVASAALPAYCPVVIS